MKKILIMLFILIFDFSYSALDTEAENIVIKKEFQEKVLRQSNSFSKCFKTGLADFEEMNNLMEKFLKMSEDILDMSEDFSLERLKNKKERNELLNTFDEILEVTELLESRLDHLYYFHALEIPNDMDVKLLTLKKELLEINAFCRNYRNFINIYYN